MYLSPLSIYYTNTEGHSEDLITETDIEKMTKSYKDKRQCPKLQVFYKNKNYFTLNNAELRVCRRLQNDGYCHRIRVERVPLKRIPKGILDMMIIPENKPLVQPDLRTTEQTKYVKVSRDSNSHEDKDVTTQTSDIDSLSSCSLESSDDEASEDDSQDGIDSDRWVSSTDESTESELEEEEESLI